MAKIGYFTNPKLVSRYYAEFIGIKLSDIDFKNKYANMPVDEGFTNLLTTICSERSGLVYVPYGINSMLAEGQREWTYLIGIKPVYEFQYVNEKGYIRAICGADGEIRTARYNVRPHFDYADDARMFIAERIAKFSTESVYDIAQKIGCYTVWSNHTVMAMPEIRREIKRGLEEAASDEPTGVRMKALVRGIIDYFDIEHTNDRVTQAFNLMVVGFTDKELRFYGYTDEEIKGGHRYNVRAGRAV